MTRLAQRPLSRRSRIFPNVFDIVVESGLLAFIDDSSVRPLSLGMNEAPPTVRQSGSSSLGEYLRRRLDRVLESWEQATRSSALHGRLDSVRLRRFLEAFGELADATGALAGGGPADSRPDRESPLALLVASADSRLSEALHDGLEPACRVETVLTEDDALRQLAAGRGDVLLVGPDARAIDLLRRARSASPEVPVVVVAPAGKIESLLECPDARDGFFLFHDTVDPAEVVLAARAALVFVRRGRSRDEEVEGLRHQAEAPAPLSKPLHVTARQAQVLALIASGLSDKEIAARLGVAHRTVRTHIDRLLHEHRLHNRTEAVAAWLRGLSGPIDRS